MKRTFLYRILLLSGAATFLAGCSGNDLETVSPDGRNRILFELDEQGALSYTVTSTGTTLVERSPAGVVTSNAGDFTTGLTFREVRKEKIDETYTLPTGKTSTYINKANQHTYIFENTDGKEIRVVTRAYDDGVAFRFVIEQPGAIEVMGEKTNITVPAGTVSWIMDWSTPNERFFPRREVTEINSTMLAYPGLMETGGKWMLLSEACVYDIPATHLTKSPGSHDFMISYAMENPRFTVNDRFESSWRTFVLGDDLNTIVRTTLLENLNPPSKITDLSWIHPGVATFPWWGDYMANSSFESLKPYVDLAAEMGWEWIEFDVALVGTPLRTSDLWETTDWLPEFTAYAKSKGVRVYGWDEIAKLKTAAGRKHIYGSYRDLGIEGIKIDYIDTESQAMMCYRDTAMSVAADYKLMVSFHGELTPRGQRRTYPHLMTQEGVRGAEYYTFRGDTPPSARHNCTLPFTRNVVGSMDYTPTTFTIRDENPRTTTYAHELALPFVFESGWVCMADRPEAYLDSPAKEMLKRVEATWDETRLIDGYPGEFVCLARRKGTSWYIGALNAETPRTVDIKLDFLADGEYEFDVYEDHPQDPMHNVNIRTERKKAGEMLTITLPPNGGTCTVIDRPSKE